MEQDNNNKDYILDQPLGYRLSRRDFLSSRICHAAGRNMFIDPKGNVSPCCFNRETVWGNLIGSGFENILNSPARLGLEKKLKVNDLGSGCQYCYNAICDRNYKAAGSLTYDLPLFQKGKFPVSMEFELDTFCNLNCVMCPPELHSSKPHDDFGPGFVEKITPLLKNLKWAKFYGGEPFVIGIYYDIWDRLIEVNPKCRITVQTNATVYNDKVKQLLAKGNFRLSVSLDSVDPENFNAIRRGASFTKVMENLEHFIQYSKTNRRPLNLAVCPMTINLKDIPGLVQYANNNSLFIYFNLLEYPRNLSPRHLSSNELGEAITLFKACDIAYHNSVSAEIKKHFDSLINQVIRWKDYAVERDNIPVEEIEKTVLVEILCRNLPPEIKAQAEQNFISGLSGFGDKIILRKDTIERISALKQERILHFLEKHNNEKMTEGIEDIIRFGF